MSNTSYFVDFATTSDLGMIASVPGTDDLHSPPQPTGAVGRGQPTELNPGRPTSARGHLPRNLIFPHRRWNDPAMRGLCWKPQRENPS